LPKLSRRTLVIGAIVLLVVVLIGLSLQPQPVGVDVARIDRGDLLVTIDDEGQTRLKDVYVVSAPVAGQVRRIDIEAGDTVTAGDTILALFEPSDPIMLNLRSRTEAEAFVKSAEAAVGLAEAEQARAQAQLDYDRAELKRAQPLAERGTISQATLDQRQLSVKTAQAQLAQATANLRKTEADLESARATLITSQDSENGDSRDLIQVRAPISGRVLRVLQKSEGVLAAGTALMELGNPAELEIVVDLLSTDAVKIKPGDRVIVDDWGGDTPLEGKVRLVEPFGFTKISALGIEEQRVNVVIDFISSQTEWQNLGHGYRVETRVVTEDRRNVLNVPIGALFRSGDQWAVFVDDDGTARLTEITLGQRNTLNAEITGGLNEGDMVILHPSDAITDGVSVTRRNSG
jgi:HlyD family secretion protein